MGVVALLADGLGHCGDTVRRRLDKVSDMAYSGGDMLRSLAILGCV
jgi:hypothetical protein